MQNRQNHVTNPNTDSVQPIPNENRRTPNYPQPNKAWLYFNIFLTFLCIVAIIGALLVTMINGHSTQFLPTFLANLAIAFIIPGIILAWACIAFANHSINQSGMIVGIIGIFVSMALGVILIINAIAAIRHYDKYHKTQPTFARNNLFAAVIPPLFVALVLITLMFCHP